MPKIATLFPINTETPQFPGKWLGSLSLIIAPLLLLTGILLRYRFNFFFPSQLKAVESNPGLMFASYSLFLAAFVLLWLGIMWMAQKIAEQRPGLALWGGSLVIFGLFARAFHAGIDHMAFGLVHSQGADATIKLMQATYGDYHIMSFFNLAIMVGWVVLALGAFQARVLPWWGAIALALMTALPLGVLKGSTTISVIAAAGLCVALIPLGVRTLKDEHPRLGAALRWTLLIGTVSAASYFFGIAG